MSEDTPAHPHEHGRRPADSAASRRSGADAIARAVTGGAFLTAALVAGLGLTACDETFTPIEPSELRFSVFGYLDASADTQWIRISPIRPTVTTSPLPLDARVTLEHLGTGRVIELRDSIFRFDAGGGGADGVYLHNFWTTEKIEPNATYRFTATGSDGRNSEAVVEIPPDFRVEVWISQRPTLASDILRIEGARQLAFINLSTNYFDTCESRRHRRSIPAGDDADVRIIPLTRQMPPIECTFPVVVTRDLRVVGTATPWPAGPEHDAGGLGIPEELSNVTNAVGYIGGVVTRSFPYEDCLIDEWPPATDYCRLRYDSTTATLRGTVWDTPCSRQVIASTWIELRELDPDVPGAPRVRTALTDQTGAYRIGALEAGKRYALRANRLPHDHEVAFQVMRWREYNDTLQVAAGATVTYDFSLRRIVDC